MRRALVLLAVAAISLAASFGGPEEVDPQAAPETLGYGTVDQIGVDGSGRAYWLTERGDKALVQERCGTGWQAALEAGDDVPVIQDLAVAPSGAAVAVWFEDSERKLWSAYRAPAGGWSTALVTSGAQMFGADAAIDGNGDAVLAWAAVQGDKVSASFRPAASGVWEAPTPLAGEGNPRVAIFNGSATVVAVDDWTVTHSIIAFPRPWGGAPETVVASDTLRGDPWIDYDPGGRPAVVWVEQTPQHYRVLKASVRSGGWPTATDVDFTDFPAFLTTQALVRHPDGLVLAYRRSDAMGVSRYGGAWSAPSTFAGDYENVTAAANADGEIVVAGSRDAAEIWATTAAGIGGGFSTPARISDSRPPRAGLALPGGGGRRRAARGRVGRPPRRPAAHARGGLRRLHGRAAGDRHAHAGASASAAACGPEAEAEAEGGHARRRRHAAELQEVPQLGQAQVPQARQARGDDGQRQEGQGQDRQGRHDQAAQADDPEDHRHARRRLQTQVDGAVQALLGTRRREYHAFRRGGGIRILPSGSPLGGSPLGSRRCRHPAGTHVPPVCERLPCAGSDDPDCAGDARYSRRRAPGDVTDQRDQGGLVVALGQVGVGRLAERLLLHQPHVAGVDDHARGRRGGADRGQQLAVAGPAHGVEQDDVRVSGRKRREGRLCRPGFRKKIPRKCYSLYANHSWNLCFLHK